MQPTSSSPLAPSTRSYDDDSSDEDEMDWEEVDVPVAPSLIADDDSLTVSPSFPKAGPSKSIEITLDEERKRPQGGKKLVTMSHAERVVRLETHKIHTICLISNGWIRNKYLNNRLLHARLMSLTPLALQAAFTQIHKKREPDAKRRGRLFEAAMMRLTQWWAETFFDTEARGSGEIQSRTFDEVAAMALQKSYDARASHDEVGEVIRSCKSLQKHVLLRYGSRDVSAQLFTALCRALGVPARLVVSLQSVPWKASVGKPKSSSRSKKRKGRQYTTASSDGGQDDMEQVDTRSKLLDPKGKGKELFPGDGQILDGRVHSAAEGKEKAKPVIKLRKQRPQRKTLASTKQSPGPPHGGYPPTQWTEVFSRADGRWLAVDPVRNFVDKHKLFEPTTYDKRNRMVYVLSFEEDGWARDVTQRYAREFTNKTSKIRVGGKGKKEWWDKVMAFLTRPYRLHRDDVEDAELQSRQVIEGMPTSVAAFKDHPVYVLERHLRRDEILHPRIEIGRFRGDPVFARANVISGLKTAESWMHTGRIISEGQQAMKWVKIRAATIGRKRAIGIAGEDNNSTDAEREGALQGLYAESQTELYRPPPVFNGKVPKNDFGNIDLYVDTMLPSGAVHIPYKGTAKIAKELGFDYAEAVTGFEFKHRRAFPIVSGVVVAAENESTLLEAYWESAHDAEEKERIKREERVLKRWTRLVQGLRIRKRLQEQYASQPSGTQAQHGVDNREDIPDPEAGGFVLETADKVVQAYTLPKPLHVIDPLLGRNADFAPIEDDILIDGPKSARPEEGNDAKFDTEEIFPADLKPSAGAPKTMQQLAEDNAQELYAASLEQSAKDSHNGASRATTASLKANGTATKMLLGDGKSMRDRKRVRTEPSPEEANNKRPRHRRSKADNTATPVVSTRSLRARIPKSHEKKRQEEELELAYRRAVAE